MDEIRKEMNYYLPRYQSFCTEKFCPIALGVSASNHLDFNTLAVPRKKGQVVGAITTLIHKETKKVLTVNVEYNQLEVSSRNQEDKQWIKMDLVHSQAIPTALPLRRYLCESTCPNPRPYQLIRQPQIR